jgi:hypothetical protein
MENDAVLRKRMPKALQLNRLSAVAYKIDELKIFFAPFCQ